MGCISRVYLYNILYMKLSERHQIPSRCATCPRLTHLSALSEMIEDGLATYVDAVTGALDPDEVRTMLSDDGIAESITDEELGEFISGLQRDLPRMMPSDHVFDTASLQQGMIERDATVLERGCPGVLRMRAIDKLGYKVTVSLCGSPSARTSQLMTGAAHEPTVVRVELAD